MELIKKLKDEIIRIKAHDNLSGLKRSKETVYILEILQDLCDGAGETKWSIKDQINLAIEELKY